MIGVPRWAILLLGVGLLLFGFAVVAWAGSAIRRSPSPTMSAPSTSRPRTPSSIAPCRSNGGSTAPPARFKGNDTAYVRIDPSGERAVLCGWLRLDKGGTSIRATRWLSEARLKVGDLKVTALFIAPADKAPGDGLNAGCLRLDEASPRKTRRSVSKVHLSASSFMPTFRQAREFLLANRTALRQGRGRLPLARSRAVQLGARLVRRRTGARGRQQRPLRPLDRRRGDGPETRLTFAELSARSNQVANWLRQQGVQRGDRLLLMLHNVAPLWEIMLAAMKLGVVVIPATTLLTGDDLADRVERGRARMIVADAGPGRQVRRPGARRRAASRSARRRSPAGWPLERCLRGVRRRSRPTARPAPTTRCCSTSPRAPPRKPKLVLHTPSQLPGRPPVDDVLDRPAAGRRALEHLLARLGQARLEQLLRAVERRRHGLRCSTTRRFDAQGAAGRAGALRRHHASARRRPCGAC